MIRAERIPPTVLVLGGVASVQFGAAFAKTLFDEVGPGGTVFLRVLFAALILCALWRPSLRGYSARDWRLILAYGFVLVAMNFTYYESLDRIPLGIAVTFEFVGRLIANDESNYGVSWICPACQSRALDVCPVGPVIPTPNGCLNCGDPTDPEGRCNSCGVLEAKALAWFGVAADAEPPLDRRSVRFRSSSAWLPRGIDIDPAA